MLVAEKRPIAAELVDPSPLSWPRKANIFGVEITPTTYDEAVDVIVSAARLGRSGIVSCHAVHALMTFSSDKSLREIANEFDMITPDGQPVRWALNLLHGTRLKERVYGPELTLRLCRRASEDGVPIYLYGGTPQVVEMLQRNLCEQFSSLVIAGYESPPFRALTDEEDSAVIDRINNSGAGLVFIGVGCPKQDLFAHSHRHTIKAVQVCVGAAFDFHAGAKSTAPAWMQRSGLEWMYRLIQEPRRLWTRYLGTNSLYLAKLFMSLLNVPNVMRQHSVWRKKPIVDRSSPNETSTGDTVVYD